MSFIAELKRRNVFKVGIAYAIVAWLLIQIASILFPTFAAPEWVMRVFTSIVILGFPIALILAWAFELTPQGIKPTPSVAPAESITRVTGQKLNVTIIGLLAFALVFVVVDNYVLKTGTRGSESVARQEQISNTSSDKGQMTNDKGLRTDDKGPVTRDRAEPAIAVLPFTDMSPNKDQDYFADGIAEEILNSLARIKDLEVRGRTSSFYFKGKNEELSTISKMLNVEYILEGSVRKAGNQVRITVQLINARKDEHLWSKTYDRTLEDIFAIQEDIAKSVADTLQISLGVGDLGRAPGMTRNVEAYDAYLAGRDLARKANRDNMLGAIEQLERAVALDPDFAVAWTQLADIYRGAVVFIPEKGKEFLAKSAAAASRAIKIAPETDFALRLAAQRSGDRVEVERLFKQALALSPDDAQTNSAYGAFLRSVGRPTEAIDYLQRAIRTEPLAASIRINLALANEYLENFTAAAAALNEGAKLSGDQADVYNSGLLVLAMEEHNRTLIDKYLPLVQGSSLLGNINRADSRDINQVMYGLLDDPQAAQVELRKFKSDPAYANPFAHSGIAVWACYFGDDGLALQIFQEEAPTTFPYWRPIHKGMRRLPGFKDLMRKVGLVDYWRKTGNWGEFCRPVGEDDFACE